MGKDAGESSSSSVIKETIVDVRKLKAKGTPSCDFYECEDVEGCDQRYSQILNYFFKDLKDSFSGDEQVAPAAGDSGFYRVPKGMRRRAGSEEEDLYEPKYINFFKIKDLFKANDLGIDDETRRQLRHYCYHLLSFAYITGQNIEVIIRELSQKREAISTYLYPDHEKPYLNDAVAKKSRTITFPDLLALAIGNCFLADLFYTSHQGRKPGWDDQECAHLWASELWADLLLLENQIPNFTRPVSLGVYLYFRDFLPLNSRYFLASRDLPDHDVNEYLPSDFHILKCVHEMLLPEPIDRNYLFVVDFHLPFRRKLWSTERRTRERVPFRTATRLQEAGIKFKPAEEEGFVVEFKKGVLKLPRLHITKSTKKVLMNLIAWEKCHRGASKYIINFAIFMDFLINTSKDVEVLTQSGVLEHSLPDEEIAALFNGLSQDHVYMEDLPEYHGIFPALSTKLNDYCLSKPNMWWANLMQDYFKSPWTIISVAAALVLILLTVLQTFFSAYSYFRPPQ